MSNAGSSSSSSPWVINVDKCMTSSGLSGYAERSIYKVPESIAGENSKLYQPEKVTLGPFYNQPGAENSILLLKATAVVPFHHTWLKQIVLKLCQDLLHSYNLGTEFDRKDWGDEFTWMMIRDGVFILEILRLGTSDHPMDVDRNRFYKLLTGYENTYVLPIIKHDILLLQNQLPFWFLELLLFSSDSDPDTLRNYKVGDQTPKREELMDLIIKCYSLPESTRKIKPPYLHILDIYRRGLISQDFQTDKTKIKHDYKYEVTSQYFPSASKLYEAAIPFVKSRTANLKDISFRRGILRLPPFVITKDTVSTLANLMAFEKLHPRAGNEITSYVFVLNCLIHNARDVSLLESHAVIQHTLRDDEDVVKSLALIGKDVVYPPDNMLEDIQIVSQQLTSRRFRKRLNIWRLDLLEKYLNTPWGALSVIAAILLFTLTIIQTIYTVLSYVHPKK